MKRVVIPLAYVMLLVGVIWISNVRMEAVLDGATPYGEAYAEYQRSQLLLSMAVPLFLLVVWMPLIRKQSLLLLIPMLMVVSNVLSYRSALIDPWDRPGTTMIPTVLWIAVALLTAVVWFVLAAVETKGGRVRLVMVMVGLFTVFRAFYQNPLVQQTLTRLLFTTDRMTLLFGLQQGVFLVEILLFVGLLYSQFQGQDQAPAGN